MVNTAGAPVTTKAAGLNCPGCGASISLSTAGWSVSVVCHTCGAVLDAQDKNLRILQQQEEKLVVQPRIELGTRGAWKGVQWEVIGFQQVTITVEGEHYSWHEYVCFNPFQGFLYLTEYQGHWNVVEKLRRRPDTDSADDRAIKFKGLTFKHFQSADARTTFALGEFPWEVIVGDEVRSHDFVSPPYLLSAEVTEAETTWSLGTYTDPNVIARAFSVRGSLPSPKGVFANQPNTRIAQAKAVARTFGVFLVVLALMLVVNVAMSRKDQVFAGQFEFERTQGDTSAFVTEPFELKGRTSNVDVTINTDLENDWLFLNLALIDENTGQAIDVGRQVSYYFGRDSEGSWSEGSRKDHFRLGSVPSGKYILRVAPEGGEPSKPVVKYWLTIKRDIPSFAFYIIAAIALVIPALFSWLRAVGFESQRWAESDHAPASSDSSSDDDE